MFVHYKFKRLAVIITVFCVVTMIYRYVYNNIININGNRLHSSRLFLDGDANISSSSAITTDKKIRKWIWYSNFNFTSKALPDVSADSAFDAMSIKPIHFDERFKNPCWKGQDNFKLLNEEHVYCLPYFYLIGVKKSGTTDLFNKISRHPDFCKPSFSKECQWISSMRFNAPNYVPKMKKIEKDIKRKGIDVKNIEFYVSMFDSAASCITRNKSSTVFNKVTADSSVATLYSHTSWEQLKVNMNLDEPRYTNFHLIKQLTPQAKLIIIFRDPTKRLYSDFLHNTRGRYKNRSPEIFHKQVQVVIAAYQNCFKSFTRRSCVYNNTLRQELLAKRIELAVSFTAGFYAVYMKDLINVFGRDQIKPILMTDYVTKMEMTLRSIFSFLNFTEVDNALMNTILSLREKNVSKENRAWPAKQETDDLLYEFYRSFNEDMAALMGDARYKFPRQN